MITVSASGPGVLLTVRLKSNLLHLLICRKAAPWTVAQWTPVADALHYIVAAARAPSPSFYELETGCCPRMPTMQLPCCPVIGTASSLQVEDLIPGAHYRYRCVNSN